MVHGYTTNSQLDHVEALYYMQYGVLIYRHGLGPGPLTVFGGSRRGTGRVSVYHHGVDAPNVRARTETDGDRRRRTETDGDGRRRTETDGDGRTGRRRTETDGCNG
jgi:hypothetical protein